jgi:ferric-dicitrate binding protein FerR (iron transport regulator)
MQPLSRKPGKLLATIVIFFAHLSVHAAECESWTAKLVSVQGVVESRAASASSWRTAGLNDTFCPGDSVRTGTHSRAAVVLPDHAVLRLDQNTTITLGTVSEGEPSWLELLEGIVHFFSRVPRSLDVRTPASRGRSSLSR